MHLCVIVIPEKGSFTGETEAPAAETESPAAEATVDSVAPKDPVSSDAE